MYARTVTQKRLRVLAMLLVSLCSSFQVTLGAVDLLLALYTPCLGLQICHDLDHLTEILVMLVGCPKYLVKLLQCEFMSLDSSRAYASELK
jgi:hypothetical protein